MPMKLPISKVRVKDAELLQRQRESAGQQEVKRRQEVGKSRKEKTSKRREESVVSNVEKRSNRRTANYSN